MSALSHNTNLVAFEKLGEMNADERARLARLDEDLQKSAAEQRLFADNVRQLIATLNRITTSYDAAGQAEGTGRHSQS